MPINTSLLDEFVDLMPQETVKHQLHALLDKQHSEVHAMTALLPQQREQAGSAAHRLKGACLLMGFTAMADALSHIERAARHTEEAVPASLVTQLTQCVDATRQALPAHLAVGSWG